MTVFSGTKQQPQYTRPLYGTHGTYTLSAGMSVPYFLTAMPIERAIEELKTHEQIPANLDNRWSLSELFQREIDQERVYKELVNGYLSDPRKLKFFNALTIVLMPKAADGKLLDKFPAADYDPPIPFDGADPEDSEWKHKDAKAHTFGGVQYITVGANGRIRWNPETVHAVAVDGQHRLHALRIYKDTIKGRSLTATEKETVIPVIFVLIAPEAGFANERAGAESSIRMLSRELFTDLNKNAKAVDRARELILDDWSIEARCMRTLVTSETARDSKDVLPLTLVRWQEENNRFDTSYYLNSLVHLDLLLDSVLELRPPHNPMEKDEVVGYIDSINTALGENGELRAGDRSLNQVYQDEYLDSDANPIRPFTRLPSSFLEASVEAFRRLHHPWILKVLLDFKPYRALLTYAREHNLIEGVFGQYHAQTRAHRALIEDSQKASDEDWKKREILDRIGAIEKLKGPAVGEGADWAFKAIFQKAMVRLARVVAFEQKGDRNLGSIDDVLTFLDALYDGGVLRVDRAMPNHEYGLWAFIGTNPVGGKIKVAQSTEDRLLAVLRLWYYANRKVVHDAAADEPKRWTARKLLSYFDTAVAVTTWPASQEAVDKLHKAMDTAVLHGKDPAQLKERTRKNKVRARLAAVLSSGIIGPLESDDDDGDGDQEDAKA
jgi:hypothetical protein